MLEIFFIWSKYNTVLWWSTGILFYFLPDSQKVHIYKKCKTNSKENYCWNLWSERVNVNIRVLGKSVWILEKSWKFLSGQEYKPCKTFTWRLPFVLWAKRTVTIDAFLFMLHVLAHIDPENSAFIQMLFPF